MIAAGLTCSGSLDEIRVEESSTSTIASGSVLETALLDLGLSSFTGFDVAANQELKNRGIERHQIDSIRIEDLALTITAPSQGDFTFINRVDFYVASEGLETQRIAYGGPFEAGEKYVVLELDDLDLAPYAVAESMTITTKVNGVRPREDTRVLAELGLLVDVNVGGALCGR